MTSRKLWSKDELYPLWMVAHSQPRWLDFLTEKLNLDAQAEDYLCDLDEAWRATAKTLESRWRREAAAMTSKFHSEIAEEQPEWVKGQRREYLEQEAARLKKQIRQGYAEFEASAQKGEPLFNRLLIIGCSSVKELERQLGRVKAELAAGLNMVGGKNRLREDQVQLAKSRPLESVLPEPPVKGFILCPVHQERMGKPDVHPSMLVKGGFGYCFSCRARLDALGYLMKVRGLGFRQAVEALQ